MIILITLTLICCNDYGQKSVSKNDQLELIPEPEKELSEKFESDDTNYKKHIEEKLKLIREKLRPLSNRKYWTSMDKRSIVTKNDSGAALYCFLNGQLRKIRFLQNTPTSDRFVEYFLENDSLFFVFEQQTDSLEFKNNPEYYEPFEDSLFFDNGDLIKIKSNMDCGAPYDEDYRTEEQVRIQTEFEKIVNRLKK